MEFGYSLMATGVKFRGIRKSIVKFKKRERKTNAYLREELVNGAEDIAELAQRMAPRHTGSLENAIEFDDKALSTKHTYRVEIFVNERKPYALPGFVGRYPAAKKVGDYAERVHREKEPAGGDPLGKSSQAKQAQNPDIIVGGGFMDRAYEAIAPDFKLQMRRAVRRGIK